MDEERDLEKMKSKIEVIQATLDELVDLVKEMNKGLYGDKKNNHAGVIDRQIKQEAQIEILREEITLIHTKNKEQDIAIDAKKDVRNKLVETFKLIAWIVVNAIVSYAIFRGTVGADALLK